MAIPKEPRQLMITIMYIVLTALLALNVSAEVFNAFDLVYQGLTESSTALEGQNRLLPQQIKERAKAQPAHQIYADRAEKVATTGEELSDYIDDIVVYLIDQSGDKDGKISDGDFDYFGNQRKPKGERDFDITTRYLVDGEKGMEFHDKIIEYREKFLEFIDTEDMEVFTQKLPLRVDQETWKESTTRRRNWADFTFNHMPVGAVLPIFAKFKNDVKASEAAVYQYLFEKMEGPGIILDQFTVASSPKKSYVIRGETFETEIFLTAYASAASGTGVSISVNGQRIPIGNDGKARWTAAAASVGEKTYTAIASVANPVTGEVKNYRQDFTYEVGEKSVTVAATKMNVFYIGVDNPVEISASGISSNLLQVSMTGGGGAIKRNADGTYNVNVTQPTRADELAYINVSAPGMDPFRMGFRVKAIPSPVAMLGGKMGGPISSGEFKVNDGIIPRLEGFDFDARCNIESYRLVWAPRREDPRVSDNQGGRFTAETRALVDNAKPGDRYFIENVRCRCPGDTRPREINSMSFVIQ